MQRRIKQAALAALVVMGAGVGGVSFAEQVVEPANCHASGYGNEYEFNSAVTAEPDERSDESWFIRAHGGTFRVIGDADEIPADAKNDYDLEIRETESGELDRSITTPDTIDYFAPYADRVNWEYDEGLWVWARFRPRFDYRTDIDPSCNADTASFVGLVLPAEPPAVCPPGQICT